MPARKPIPIGVRFTRLVVISSGTRIVTAHGSRYVVVCACKCGVITTVSQGALRNGASRSCGCLQREIASNRNTRHGHVLRINGKRSPSVYYRTWLNMVSRCHYRRDVSFSNYGGRGITVHKPWRKDFRVFLRYLKRHGMYPRPDGCSIDRIDNDGNYEPGNIRWATRKEQRRNQRQ